MRFAGVFAIAKFFEGHYASVYHIGRERNGRIFRQSGHDFAIVGKGIVDEVVAYAC